MVSKNFIDYAIKLLYKDRADHAFSFIIFTFIVFILSSVLFISSSIQNDLSLSIQNSPSVVVEAVRAGKKDTMHDGYIYDIKRINGVSDAWGVVDGYYYFGQKRIWFHIIGLDELDENEMIIGEGVKREMAELYYEDVFNFLTEHALIPIKINKTASHSSNIITNDVIYLNPTTARAVLSLEEGEYTKIYVDVPNENEISQVALSISNLYPNTQALSMEDRISDIRHLYYYKGGIFMVIYSAAMISFFILLKNQISLAYGSKKREIAILRSIGYAIKDIIALKFIQNFTVATSAFLLGVALAYIYIFIFNAPLLRNVFLGLEIENSVTFTPIVDFNMLFLIFLFSVIPFLAFVIIPSWRIAIADMSEAVK
ncbi:ABC transporter permease [Campylobacter sp. RM13119]|uniref:ABC transporter permease n=1 Tax=Campylobacter TaxID=194 RepID=UPI0014746FCF|nr:MULTISPECIES: FtsX-like permease family protein [unclassified Campylobacter]MBE3022188.1 ABC transporter permease [Campylobacter sp. 7477a]MBE3605432.1 ABC transporter permease [Campylobacter sp. RM13119]